VNLYFAIRRFTDIGDIYKMIPGHEWDCRKDNDMTYYAAGKLAFDLLPILLSKLESLKGSGIQEISNVLRDHHFQFINNDPLEWEKAKAKQAIEDFLKV
jgi:hypothetical protein